MTYEEFKQKVGSIILTEQLSCHAGNPDASREMEIANYL